ncbi:MAG: phosphoglycerate dehydrogenase-like enzyme [Planctomycetota bacterium]|jgi:phosphoglycerate dehydrogenase-like enzyme
MRNLLLLGALVLASACIQAPPALQTANVLAVGSSEGSVIALEPGEDPLVYLASGMDARTLEELAVLAPNVQFVTGLSGAEGLARASEFHGADARLLTPEFLEAATNLRWVQSWSAGVDRYLDLDGLIQNKDIVLTNMQGIHGPVIAEHVMALLLSLSRDLPAFHEAQQASIWDRNAGSGQRALAGSTLCVVGMGGIGTEVARRAFGFDMRVLATVRTPRKAPAYVHEIGIAEDTERFLAESDVVVICLPLTPETRGMFNAELLAKMKPNSILINIARGAIVDSNALLAALESGHIAAAGLDVTDPEPLPSSHGLWVRDDVLITPHTAGAATLTGIRRDILFVENIRRFGAGKGLLNVVDKAAGY